MKARAKAAKPARVKAYRAPIANDRFKHMLTALLGHIRGLDRERSIRSPGFAEYRIQRRAAGEELDEATALEIADALYKLRAHYCEEALRDALPNKRESMRELQDAANAQMLIDVYGFDAASAVEAVAGNPRQVERDSLARSQRNRSAKARQRGIEPDWKAITAARANAKKTER